MKSVMLIIGEDGYLGSSLMGSSELKERFSLVGVGRGSGFDLAQTEFFPKLPPAQYMVMTAAVSDVETCARNPLGTRRINVDGTIRLFELGIENHCVPVFFSSDYVLSHVPGAMKEDYLCGPRTEYGRQKLEVEEWLKAHAPRHLVFRTSKLMGEVRHPRNMLTQMERALSVGSYTAFSDQWITPVSVCDVARILSHPGLKELNGTFHLASKKIYSRYELAIEMKNILGLTGEVLPGRTTELKTLESRPTHHTLDASLISETLQFRFKEICDILPSWKD